MKIKFRNIFILIFFVILIIILIGCNKTDNIVDVSSNNETVHELNTSTNWPSNEVLEKFGIKDLQEPPNTLIKKVESSNRFLSIEFEDATLQECNIFIESVYNTIRNNDNIIYDSKNGNVVENISIEKKDTSPNWIGYFKIDDDWVGVNIALNTETNNMTFDISI